MGLDRVGYDVLKLLKCDVVEARLASVICFYDKRAVCCGFELCLGSPLRWACGEVYAASVVLQDKRSLY